MKKFGGYIATYGLDDWWLQSFTNEERAFMEEKFDASADFHFGIRLASGKTTVPKQSSSFFLNNLSSWFNTKEHYELTLRIMRKAEAELHSITNVSDYHFYLLNQIKFYYKNRDIGDNFQEAIACCKKQIDIAPQVKKQMLTDYPSSNLPSHTGYEQLAIVYEKDKEYDLAIDLCMQAKKEGWAGEWDKRIERCSMKKSI